MLQSLSKTGAIGFVVWASLLVQARESAVNIPQWMRQAASRPLATYPAETKAVVLLDQTDYNVTGPGECVEHTRWVAKILRPEGRSLGHLAVDLRQGEKLNSIHAWTLDSSLHQYELKAKDFIERSLSSDELYSDIKLFTAEAPAPDPGSILAFEFEARRHPIFNQINQFLAQPHPVRELEISLTLPPGWEARDSYSDQIGLVRAAAGTNGWHWTAHDLEGIQDEPQMPPKSALLDRLSITYFQPGNQDASFSRAGSWNALGEWYSRLTEGRSQPTPEIRLQVERLTAGKTDFDSKLRALTAFVQSEIRYVAIEIGIGGYQPHPAAEIFSHRYGDCKDKATLLASMLELAGIHTQYVLIDSDRGFVNAAVPSIWFDHVITAIEIPESASRSHYDALVTAKSGKRYLLFDPTDEYTPVGGLSPELQASDALLVTAGAGELLRTPLLPPESNRILRTGHFVLAENGGITGEVTEERHGDPATRERMSLQYADQRQRMNEFEGWLARSVQGFSLDSVDILKATLAPEDFTIRYKFTAPQYAQLRGPLMLVRPRVLDEKALLIEHKPRRYPIALPRTAHEVDIYEIELPAHYQIDDLPDPVRIDVGFASYQSSIQVEGLKLRYRREYVVRDLMVPSGQYEQWTRLEGMIGADEAAAVVLKRLE
ncbi:MAG: DUF3857 domain-containing protein, partial [Acidobacteria bacterium]|nr:DUF3857 domain-containing protein [Acidobacteriota bacterium]